MSSEYTDLPIHYLIHDIQLVQRDEVTSLGARNIKWYLKDISNSFYHF